VLIPALVFAPNWAARKKALGAFKLFREALGPLKRRDTIIYATILGTATVEWVRILGNRLVGREGIVRQPRCRRTEGLGRRAELTETADAANVAQAVGTPLPVEPAAAAPAVPAPLQT